MQNLSSANLNYINSILKKDVQNTALATDTANSSSKSDSVELSSKKPSGGIKNTLLNLKDKIMVNKSTVIMAVCAIGALVISIAAILNSRNTLKVIQENQNKTNELIDGLKEKLDSVGQSASDSITIGADKAGSKTIGKLSAQAEELSGKMDKIDCKLSVLENKTDALSENVDNLGKEYITISKGFVETADALTSSIDGINEELKTDIQNGFSGLQKNMQEGFEAIQQDIGKINIPEPQQAPNLENFRAQMQSGIEEIAKNCFEKYFAQFSEKAGDGITKLGENQTAQQQKQLETLQKNISDEISKKFTSISKAQLTAIAAQITQTIALGAQNSQNTSAQAIQESAKNAAQNIMQDIDIEKLFNDFTQNVQTSAQKTVQDAICTLQQESSSAIKSIENASKNAISAVEQQSTDGISSIENASKNMLKSTQTAISQSAKEAIEDTHIRGQKSIDGINSTLKTAIDKMAGTQQAKPAETIKEKTTANLEDIKFQKGMAFLKDGSKFTGELKDKTPSGQEFSIVYKDGKMQTSKIGAMQKIYSTQIKDGKVTEVINTTTSTGVDSTYICRYPENGSAHDRMAARKYIIDHANNLKREVLQFNLDEKGKWKRYAACDGPYNSAVGKSGFSKELSERISKYNADELQKGNFTDIQIPMGNGFIAHKPSLHNSIVDYGNINSPENTMDFRTRFPKGPSSVLAENTENGKQVIRFKE